LGVHQDSNSQKENSLGSVSLHSHTLFGMRPWDPFALVASPRLGLRQLNYIVVFLIKNFWMLWGWAIHIIGLLQKLKHHSFFTWRSSFLFTKSQWNLENCWLLFYCINWSLNHRLLSLKQLCVFHNSVEIFKKDGKEWNPFKGHVVAYINI